MYQSIRLNPLATLCLLMIFLLSTTVDADETIEVGYRGCTFNDAIRAANTNQTRGRLLGGRSRARSYLHSRQRRDSGEPGDDH